MNQCQDQGVAKLDENPVSVLLVSLKVWACVCWPPLCDVFLLVRERFSNLLEGGAGFPSLKWRRTVTVGPANGKANRMGVQIQMFGDQGFPASQNISVAKHERASFGNLGQSKLGRKGGKTHLA